MLFDEIKNIEGKEVNNIIDRNNSSNSKLFITAINRNPCEINNKYISRVIDECGFYFVWKNLKGGYRGWLFDLVHSEDLKTKDLGSIQNTTTNQAKNFNPIEHFGFDTTKTRRFKSAVPITHLEIDEVKTILTSHEVYLYMGERFSGDIKFMRIQLSDGSYKQRQNDIEAYDLEIEITNPVTTQNRLWH